MSYESEGKELLALVGGKENVRNAVHCATRLRFELADESKADKAAIEKLPYTLKVIESGGQFQVVIGPEVHDYYLAVLAAAGMGEEWGTSDNAGKEEVKRKPADIVLKLISGSFSPLIPVMAGSGMVKALLTLLVTFGILSDASSTYLVLSAAGNACFYFFPVLLGYTVSNQLGANPFVGAAIGAALLEPNFTGLVGAEGTDFLGIPLQAVSYGSTIFPIFIAAIIYSFLDRAVRKVVSKDLQLFLAPMICLVIMVPFTALLFGPWGNNIGNAIAAGVQWLFNTSSLLAGLVLGAVYPYLTMLGLHWGFTPITLQNLELYGGDVIEGVCVCAVWAQIGVCLGMFLVSRKGSKMRDVAGPTLITGFLAGVTEPILYGIIMNYKRLMIAVAIAGGVGGAINALFGSTMNSYVFHNIISVVTLCYGPMPLCVLGMAASLVVGTLITFFWAGRDPEMAPELASAEDVSVAAKPVEEAAPAAKADSSAKVAPAATGENAVAITAPVAGSVIAMADVHDGVFASGVMGPGVGIVPEGDLFVSPVDGTLAMLFDTKHAMGFTTPEGVELLVHIGIDTVELGGEGFEALAKQGDTVRRGQPVMRIDRELIASKGYSLDTPMIVTSANGAPESVSCVAPGHVDAGDQIITVRV